MTWDLESLTSETTQHGDHECQPQSLQKHSLYYSYHGWIFDSQIHALGPSQKLEYLDLARPLHRFRSLESRRRAPEYLSLADIGDSTAYLLLDGICHIKGGVRLYRTEEYASSRQPCIKGCGTRQQGFFSRQRYYPPKPYIRNARLQRVCHLCSRI